MPLSPRNRNVTAVVRHNSVQNYDDPRGETDTQILIWQATDQEPVQEFEVTQTCHCIAVDGPTFYLGFDGGWLVRGNRNGDYGNYQILDEAIQAMDYFDSEVWVATAHRVQAITNSQSLKLKLVDPSRPFWSNVVQIQAIGGYRHEGRKYILVAGICNGHLYLKRAELDDRWADELRWQSWQSFGKFDVFPGADDVKYVLTILPQGQVVFSAQDKLHLLDVTAEDPKIFEISSSIYNDHPVIASSSSFLAVSHPRLTQSPSGAMGIRVFGRDQVNASALTQLSFLRQVLPLK